MTKRVAIGIDLGTTNSCVGVFGDGKVDILENDLGNKTTPSRVAFDGSEIHVGEAAKALAADNPKNTVFEVKRLIGRKFADVTVQEDIKQWPFVVFNDNGTTKIRVDYRREKKVYLPQQISAMVLKSLKQFVERSTGGDIQDAVITVPAYFNDSQRHATIDAGKIAGLNVLSIINEPTAAALAFGYKRKQNHDQTVMIYDLGGGTFDVSIISVANKEFHVKAVGGDSHLGGVDFDVRLVNHFLKIAKDKHGKDISSNPVHLWHLRDACEKAKKQLSTRSGFRAKVFVFGILDGKNFDETLTRATFEQLCLNLFEKTIEHVKNVLHNAGMNKSDIDEVILVGGSSRIPKVQELLSEFFDGKKLNATINPDEAVAYGAAVKAALDSGEYTIEEFSLKDVVPWSLGINTGRNNTMSVFIKQNSQIPIKVIKKNISTTYGYRKILTVDVYEGERSLVTNNNLLGTFSFDLGEQVQAGVPKLTCTFEVDVNGILHVSAVNENTQKSGGLTIISEKGGLSKEEIETMMQEAEHLRIT